MPIGELQEIASDVACLPGRIVNLFMVGEPGGAWTLVDTGMPGSAAGIISAAKARFGKNSRPSAIVLTHGHFDHIGSVRALASLWDVPVYAHYLEMPYLTGRSKYPPFDPTVGGFFPFLSRFFPESGVNLGERAQVMSGEELPSLPGWKVIETPGHSPGHVSLYRESDGVLIAGDAVTSMDMTSFSDWATRKPEIAPPPTYATCDWQAAQTSALRLAALRPRGLATGHGDVLSGPDVADRLEAFARSFPVPEHGRYVAEPAWADDRGVEYIPPPVPDPVPAVALGLGTMAVAGFALARARRR